MSKNIATISFDTLYDACLYIAVRCNWRATRHSIRAIRDREHANPLIGIEIGTQHGAHAQTLLEQLNIKKLYLIDPYIWYSEIDDTVCTPHTHFKQEAQQRMQKYANKVEFVEMFSADAVAHINEQVDFVYIDGNHKYRFVKEDLELYYPLVKQQGIICGHDFNMPDVARAVTTFAAAQRLVVRTGGLPTDWWMVKL